MTDQNETSSQPSFTKEEEELASFSNTAYLKDDYRKCQGYLKKLQGKRTDDPKVINNCGIVEFLASSYKNIDKLKESFQRIEKVMGFDVKDCEKIEDLEHCVIFYNQAILCYYLHQHYTAIKILDKILLFIEALDTSFARQVSLLLMELYLVTNQPDKALGLLNFVDKLLFTSNDAVSKKNGKESTKDSADKSGEITKDEQEISLFKPKIMQLKVRSYIMMKSMKTCRREAKSLMASGNTMEAAYLKANTEYIRNNFKKAMRLMNSYPLVSPERFVETADDMIVNYNNNVGCMNLYLAKPHLAQLYFTRAYTELHEQIQKLTQNNSNKNIPLMTRTTITQHKIFYNIGLSFLFADKPEKAFDYLMKCVDTFNQNPRLWLRIAECCIKIHKKSNEDDFNDDEKNVNVMKSCFSNGIHRKVIINSNISVEQQSRPADEPLSKKPSLRFANLCLNTALMLTGHRMYILPSTTSSKSDSSFQNNEQEVLAGSNSNTIANESKNQLIVSPPSNPIYGPEIASLKISILAASCYVNLGLDNPYLALNSAKEILGMPKVPLKYQYLANMYLGEALVMINQVEEAIEHFDMNLFGQDFNIFQETPSNMDSDSAANDPSNNSSNLHKDAEKITNHFTTWFPENNVTARNAMLYNQAAGFALLKDFDKANINLNQLAISKGQGSQIPIHTVTLAMYLQLYQGLGDHAKNKIRQTYPQYF